MVLRFCRYCANLLRFKEHPDGNRFACPTCPYIWKIRGRVTSRTYFTGKLTDTHIVTTEAAYAGLESTEERCPKCSHPRAYVKQIQIRSADEPMTLFYKCCDHACGHTWRVDP